MGKTFTLKIKGFVQTKCLGGNVRPSSLPETPITHSPVEIEGVQKQQKVASIPVIFETSLNLGRDKVLFFSVSVFQRRTRADRRPLLFCRRRHTSVGARIRDARRVSPSFLAGSLRPLGRDVCPADGEDCGHSPSLGASCSSVSRRLEDESVKEEESVIKTVNKFSVQIPPY